jgi:hypothetical protein
LWETNGTAAGTHEVTAIAGAAPTGLNPSNLTVFNDEVLFNGGDSGGLNGLWATNATVPGTFEVIAGPATTGQTFTWTGIVSGNWNNLTDWTPVGFYPGESEGGDAALIQGISQTVRVTVSATPPNPISTLTINDPTATLSFSGTTTLTVTGGTSLSAGTIQMEDTPGVLSTGTFTESGTGI